MATPRCKKCKKKVLMIDDGSGLPAMIGFQLESGETINMCRGCLMDLGRAKESGDMAEWDKFFEQYK